MLRVAGRSRAGRQRPSTFAQPWYTRCAIARPHAATMQSNSVELRALIGLNAFAALSALSGGFAILAGWILFPADWLRASPFSDYTTPGVILFVIVGGSAVVATIAELRRSMSSAALSAVAGSIMMGWILVEIAIIQQVAWPHVLYFAVGFGIAMLAVRQWRSSLSSSNRAGVPAVPPA